MNFQDITYFLPMAYRYGTVDDLLAIAYFKERSARPPIYATTKPEKIDGMAVILVLEGRVDVEFNANRYVINRNSFVVVPPATVFRLCENHGETGEAYLLFMAPQFLSELNINYASLALPLGVEKPSPVTTFSSDKIDQLRRIFDLLLNSTRFKVSPRLDRGIAASIITTLIYQVVQFYIKSLEADPVKDAEQSRPSGYVQEFLRLLQIHYMKERSVSFYADQLYISPKYLSLLVKKATGRSASRWIDDRVIMEARNLLRFSGKNVQQVAYMLNFSNQSAFGKYFKHLTGMSPTEYQKG